MKSNIKNLRKIVPFVKEYAENVGKHHDQPDICITNRDFSGENMWMGNAVIASLNKKGITRHRRQNTYCFGGFFSGYGSKNNNPILVQIQDRFPDLSEEAYRSYIEWVIKYSPWSDAFLSKNINTVMKKRVAVIDGDNPKWYKKEAAIAIRMAWENYYNNCKYRNADLWWMVAQKTNPNLAYIAGWLMTKRDGNRIIMKNAESGHTPINFSADIYKHLNGWVGNKKNESAWMTEPVENSYIYEDVNKIIKSIGSDGSIVNPFSWMTAKEYKLEAFLEAMHSELPKLEGYLK